MRVALITDVTLQEWIGGGTLVNDYIARSLVGRGHDVQFIKINERENGWDSADHTQIDLYLVANIPFMTNGQMVQMIESGKPYIVFRHDIASLCYLDEPKSHPAAELISRLFARARGNIFISYMQLAYYQRICPINNAFVVPPPLDLGAFVDQRGAERQGHLYLGEISEARGIAETVAAMQATGDAGPMLFCGQIKDAASEAAIRACGAEHRGELDHAEIPELLNKYRHFYYYPRIFDAFCLKVVEAELCGMTLHVRKENIGRYYYQADARQLAEFMRDQSMAVIFSLLAA